MPATLLRTKLHAPPLRPDLVPRQHLIERLNQGLESGGRFTLVSAPAGFGKTTLVAAWAQQLQQSVAWLSLEEADNDLIRFLSYLVAALQSVDGEIGTGILAALQSPEPVDQELLLTTLLNETTELSDDVVLVLDDYHVIESRPIHGSVAFLLDHLSLRMHLVMSTRADPPFPLPRMRAGGELVELRVRDLRFSLDESTTFLHTILGSELSREDVRKLQNRTEGWIAGLQLAALAVQGRADSSEMIASFAGGHQYILDYLVEEVLDRQTESLRAFLLRTSILGKLSGALCDAVTGRSDGDATLEWCEKANLFVSPLAGEYGWYRYHRLFANVMAERLQRFYPDQVPDLHLRAAAWYGEHDLFDEAVKHALAANDHQLAAEIVEGQARHLLHRGDLSTLMGWLGKLPAEIVQRRPRLGVDSAWVSLLIGELERIESYLAPAEQNLDDLDDAQELRGQIAAIRAYAAGRLGNLDRAIDQANVALELLPGDDFSVRCVVAFVLGGTYQLKGDLVRAMSYLREASQLGVRAENIHLAVAALNLIGDIHRSQGELEISEQLYDQALQLGSDDRGRSLPITAGVYANLAESRLAQNDLVAARKLSLTGLELGRKWVNAESQVACYLVLAQMEHLEGNPGEAHSNLEKAKRLAATSQLPPARAEQINACEQAISAVPTARADQGLLEPLSSRELEVLGLFAEGLTNREIADRLIISLGTVKAHSSNIYRKLEVRNRVQAVLRAGELQLL